MKRIVSLLFSLLLFSLLLVPAFAHPGGTDGGGGHYDHSTGEYHYHHGHSAHQHYDMDDDGVPDCPYNFSDKTSRSSSSSNSNTKSKTLPKSTPSPISTPKPSVRSSSSSSRRSGKSVDFDSIFMIVIILSPSLFIIVPLIQDRKREPKQRCSEPRSEYQRQIPSNDKPKQLPSQNSFVIDKPKQLPAQNSFVIDKSRQLPAPNNFDFEKYLEVKKQAEAKRQLEAQRRAAEKKLRAEKKQQKFLEEKEQYTLMYGSVPTLGAADAPPRSFVDSDNLPGIIDFSNTKWGIPYTFYVTESGKCYHKKDCRIILSKSTKEINAVYLSPKRYRYDGIPYLANSFYYSCSYCLPDLPDLSWYFKYLDIKKIRDKYHIPEP